MEFLASAKPTVSHIQKLGCKLWVGTPDKKVAAKAKDSFGLLLRFKSYGTYLAEIYSDQIRHRSPYYIVGG